MKKTLITFVASAMTLALVLGILSNRAASRAVRLEESDHAVTKATVDHWMSELSNWSRWGKDDERGTLNLLTLDRRKRALSIVSL